MSTLKSRYGLQGLEHQGVFVNDLPGLVAQGKSFWWYTLTLEPVPGPDRLAVMKQQLDAAVLTCREEHEWDDLHLYYLDVEGHAVLSLNHAEKEAPYLSVAGHRHSTAPRGPLIMNRTYQATGKLGVHTRNHEDVREPFVAFEKYLAAYELGWGGLFFSRETEERERLFRSFNPLGGHLLQGEERLDHLVFTLSFAGWHPVTTVLESATLSEAVAWK